MPLSYLRKSASGPEGNCPECVRVNLTMLTALGADLPFPEAFRVWMEKRSIQVNGTRAEINYLARDSERDYRTCARALEHYFAGMRLNEIDAGHLVEYQNMRATNPADARGEFRLLRGRGVHGPFATRELAEAWAKAHTRGGGPGYELTRTLWPRPAGANAIRKEVALLMRILRAAKLWTEEESKLVPRVRAEEPDVARAMTQEEQHRLLHVAASRLEYRFIYQYAIVALQTTAGPNELRSMRLSDVLLQNRVIQIPRRGAKNKYRARTIPLCTEDAVWAMQGLLDRARELGSVDPAHYLFPFRVMRVRWDPARPMTESGLKKHWNVVRRAAGMPELRVYDLRHTGITRMAEAGVPLPVAMSYAGHMTQKMQQHYISICMASQRGWGEAVWGTAPGKKPVMTQPVAAFAARRA